jgi:hypothetical protein
MEFTLSDGTSLLFQLAMGLSLAACAGLRAFLPLFVVGLAGRLDQIPLMSSFEWLASTPALVAFGAAIVIELLGDKFPVVDNFLDAAQGFVKPIAGTILMAGVLSELTPLQATVLGIIGGGTAAGTVHLTKAKVRLISSATTAGVGNPFLSIAEDFAALVGTLLSFVFPLLVVFVVLVSLIMVWRGVRRMLRGAPRPAPP